MYETLWICNISSSLEESTNPNQQINSPGPLTSGRHLDDGSSLPQTASKTFGGTRPTAKYYLKCVSVYTCVCVCVCMSVCMWQGVSVCVSASSWASYLIMCIFLLTDSSFPRILYARLCAGRDTWRGSRCFRLSRLVVLQKKVQTKARGQ